MTGEEEEAYMIRNQEQRVGALLFCDLEVVRTQQVQEIFVHIIETDD